MSVFRKRLKRFKNWLHRYDGGQRLVAGKGKQMENDKWFPFILEYFNQGAKTLTINLKGRSMRPFLESDRDKALLAPIGEVKVGDPVLAENFPGHFVLHRIVKLEGDDVTLMGDGNLTYEYCKLKDLRASVIGFYRKGNKKLDRTDGMKWKTYSWIWMHLRPIRRYLLAFYRYVWLNIFRLKSPKNK